MVFSQFQQPPKIQDYGIIGDFIGSANHKFGAAALVKYFAAHTICIAYT